MVEELFGHIERDPRHHQVTVVARGGLSERMFMDWSMGLRDLRTSKLGDGMEGVDNDRLFAWYRDHPVLCVNLFEAITRYL